MPRALPGATNESNIPGDSPLSGLSTLANTCIEVNGTRAERSLVDGGERRVRETSTTGQNMTLHKVTSNGLPMSELPDYRTRSADGHRGVLHLELISVIVDDCDSAIAFFVDKPQFDLIEDPPERTTDDRNVGE
jgi:hypothetical protein